MEKMTRNELKILVTDDSALTRKQITDMLSELGCTNIIEAKNGLDAIEKFKVEKPNVCFLDIIMPECDGIDATKAIMEIDDTTHVVICSTVGTQAKLKEAINAGAREFIQKPARRDQLDFVLSKIAED